MFGHIDKTLFLHLWVYSRTFFLFAYLQSDLAIQNWTHLLAALVSSLAFSHFIGDRVTGSAVSVETLRLPSSQTPLQLLQRYPRHLSWLLSKGVPSHPSEKANFSCLYPGSLFFHYKTIDWPVKRSFCLSSFSCLNQREDEYSKGSCFPASTCSIFLWNY